MAKLDDPQVLHTLGYIRSISNQKEFILEEALAVCLHKVHSAKFQVVMIVIARFDNIYIKDILLQL